MWINNTDRSPHYGISFIRNKKKFEIDSHFLNIYKFWNFKSKVEISSLDLLKAFDKARK